MAGACHRKQAARWYCWRWQNHVAEIVEWVTGLWHNVFCSDDRWQFLSASVITSSFLEVRILVTDPGNVNVIQHWCCIKSVPVTKHFRKEFFEIFSSSMKIPTTWSPKPNMPSPCTWHQLWLSIIVNVLKSHKYLLLRLTRHNVTHSRYQTCRQLINVNGRSVLQLKIISVGCCASPHHFCEGFDYVTSCNRTMLFSQRSDMIINFGKHTSKSNDAFDPWNVK